jgi:hypothetical protein
MSCYKYWAKISAIADALRIYDRNHVQKKSLDEIIPLLDAIEVIAHDTTIEFDSARHILENERMNDALKTIRGSYVAVSTRLEMQQAYDILDAEESWTPVEFPLL